MIHIGVDPGASGAIAFVPGAAPAWCVKLNGDLADVADSLREARSMGPCHATLEAVHSSPQMGVRSAFSFGRSFGQVEALLVALKIPFSRVSPQRWQKDMHCRTGGDKNITKRLAAELFPQLRVTHATADALLLALWGRKFSPFIEKNH